MALEQGSDRLRLEQAPARYALLTEKVIDQIPQLMAQPAAERHVESVLRPVNDLGRQSGPQRVFHQELAFRALHLQSAGQLKCPFHEMMIEEGHASLETEG